MKPKSSKKSSKKEVEKLPGVVPLSQAFLESLQGADCVEFPMDECDDAAGNEAVYRGVLLGIIKASTGVREIVEITDVKDIPRTLLESDSPVFVIHITGKFDNTKCDHFLMVDKQTVYLLAVKRINGWYEVLGSKRPIAKAEKFGFVGSYSELSGGGTSTTDKPIKLGLLPLKWAIMSVVRGECTVIDFLTIAVNLFEAARYKFIADLVVRSIHIYRDLPMDARVLFLVHSWGQIRLSCELY